MFTTRKIVAAIFVLVAIIGGVLLVHSQNNRMAPTTTANPYPLEGVWESDKSGGQSYMTATIANDTIDIIWHMDTNTEAVYWSGSFPMKTATGDLEVLSTNDMEKTSRSMFASNSSTKAFSYSDGEMTFQFTALGTTKTITLRK